MAEENRQIKSKARVRAHGEVFTAPREVNAMLDLVKDETERIDATFLEPACGDGNFLDEVLRRKLAVCRRRYGRSAADYEKFSFLACTTLYGVDILADNVARCRERLFARWEGEFAGKGVSRLLPRGGADAPPAKPDAPPAIPGFPSTGYHDRVARAVRFVFERNILLGNALSMKRVDERQNDLDEPLAFTEWKFVSGDKLARAEYRFDVLLEKGAAKRGEAVAMTFDFFGGASTAVNWMPDPDDRWRMIPAPSKSYPLIDYWRLGDE